MRAWWRNLVAGFWLVPGALATGLFLLAVVIVELERGFGGEHGFGGFEGDSSAARDILATIATSVATVAGVVFSITILVLSMVSSQFTPRALRSFLSDRVNQLIAGAFVGIFAYCLVVLRSVRGDDVGDRFVPGLALTLGVALGFVAIALLLMFIHHMGEAVQLAHIVARIGRQTLSAIDVLYPEEHGVAVRDSGAKLVERWRSEGEPAVVRPQRPGYLQAVAVEGIVEKLEADGVRIHVPVHPGDFVTEEQPILEAWPADAVTEADAEAVRDAFTISNEREVSQDVAFGLRQLADIAAKALSPGVNDPSTALAALAYVFASLERLAGRDIPVGERKLGRATAVLESRDFDEFVEEPIGSLARSAAGDARVAAEMLRGLARVARAVLAAAAAERLAVLERLAEAIAEPAREAVVSAHERALVEAAYEDARAVLGERVR